MRKHREGLTPERIAEMEAELRFHDTVSDKLNKHLLALEKQLEALNAEVNTHINAYNDLDAALYEPPETSGALTCFGNWSSFAGLSKPNGVLTVTVQTPAQRVLAGERFREGIVQMVTDKKDGTTELCIAASYASADFPSVYKTHRAVDGTPVFFSKQLEFNKEPYLGTDKCRCDMSTIMATGCKCGGK